MRRITKLLLAAVAILAFLAISALLARAFGAEGAERTAITALVQQEVHGDSGGLIARWQGCGAQPSCRALAARLSSSLRRAGTLSVLELQPSTGFSLTSTRGIARVAWSTSSVTRPVVQCVLVRRAGNVLSALRIELLRITPPIRSDSNCPGGTSGP